LEIDQGSGFKVPSSKFKVPGSRFKVPGSKFKVPGSRFKVPGSRFKVQGSGFKVPGSRFRVLEGLTDKILNKGNRKVGGIKIWCGEFRWKLSLASRAFLLIEASG
jgi:hypothetical protein